jgi:hypothetical protein
MSELGMANRVDSFSCKKFQKFLIALFAFS